MLEIAGGVVLGGVILWILAAFAEPLIKLVMWIVGIAAAVFALFLVGEVFVGAYNTTERIHGQDIPSSLPDSMFGFALLIGVIALLYNFWLILDSLTSLLRRWWKRYRIVAGHIPPIVLAHAPYMWMARIKQRSFPLSHIQMKSRQID